MNSIEGVRQRLYQRAGTERLAVHLEQRYGVGVSSLTEIDGGVHRVDRADGSTWVARLFSAARPFDRTEGDAAVLRFLEEQDLPAERCAHAEPVSTLEGQAVIVTEYVPGALAGDDDATLHALGELLGRLHTLPIESGAPTRAAGSLHHWSANEGAPREELAAASAWLTDAEPVVADVHRSLYASLREQVAQTDDGRDLPQALIHPDFNQGNAIATPGGDLVVIDWTGTGRGPRVVSLAGLLYLAVVGHPGAPHRSPDLGRVEPVIAGYRSHVELDDDELARLPDLLRARPLILECFMFAVWKKPLPDTLRQTSAIVELTNAIAARTREVAGRE